MPASEGQHFQFTLRGVLVLLTLSSLPLAFFTRASGGWWISVQVIAAMTAVWLYRAGSVPRTDRLLIIGCVAILTAELLVSYLAGLSTVALLLIYLPLLLVAPFGFLTALVALLQGMLPDSRQSACIWPRAVTRGCVLIALVPVLPVSPAFRLGMRDRIHLAAGSS